MTIFSSTNQLFFLSLKDPTKLYVCIGEENIQDSVFYPLQDPDGGNIQYRVISGHLPPGTSLNSSTGVITGTAPDIDATYTFGIRATDRHGKYADGTFSIDIRGFK